MQVLKGATLFSASDLVNFLECEHTTTLGLVDLITPLQRAESDESNKFVQGKGFAHEESFLASLRAQGLRITEIPQHLPAEVAARATLEALTAGPDIIFQAAFLSPPFYGRADFLRRVEGRSRFGDWQYEVMDTKLARSVKAKFVIQLCFYSDLLAQAQAAEPRSMHLVLGRRHRKELPVRQLLALYGRLDADIAQVMMGINAVKGVEIGAGFRSVEQLGTEHGDEMRPEGFLSNNAGGIRGGIDGQDVVGSIAIKPTVKYSVAAADG